LAELRALSSVFADDFFDAITLEATLDCHDVAGGTARTRVAAAVAATKQNLGENN
jgi:argininosuccinate lyase